MEAFALSVNDSDLHRIFGVIGTSEQIDINTRQLTCVNVKIPTLSGITRPKWSKFPPGRSDRGPNLFVQPARCRLSFF